MEGEKITGLETQDSLTKRMRFNGRPDPVSHSTNGSRQGSADAWATPQSRDFRSGQSERWDDENRSRNINDQMANETWGTPSVTSTGGPTGLGGGSGNKAKMTAMGEEGKAMCTARLNPRWVETLMGLPIGWTSPAPCTHTTCTSRTDELRLLGNGVVPQTAELAFRVLMDKIKS
jgi:DNA (cytosine-5)-methyltransferase 1